MNWIRCQIKKGKFRGKEMEENVKEKKINKLKVNKLFFIYYFKFILLILLYLYKY